MVELIINYLKNFPDLSIFIALFLGFFLFFAIFGSKNSIQFTFSIFLGYVIAISFPKIQIIENLKIHKFITKDQGIFVLATIIIFIFFIITRFLEAQANKSIIKALVFSLIISFLLFSFYFELGEGQFEKLSKFIDIVFNNNYSKILIRGASIILLPIFSF